MRIATTDCRRTHGDERVIDDEGRREAIASRDKKAGNTQLILDAECASAFCSCNTLPSANVEVLSCSCSTQEENSGH
jgi:hypothetical protein